MGKSVTFNLEKGYDIYGHVQTWSKLFENAITCLNSISVLKLFEIYARVRNMKLYEMYERFKKQITLHYWCKNERNILCIEIAMLLQKFFHIIVCAAREEWVSEQPKMIMRQLVHIIIPANNFRLTYYCFFHPLFFFFQAECQNHIRIVAKMSEEVLLLCGTHAYKPKCRHYAFKVRQTAWHNEAKQKPKIS